MTRWESFSLFDTLQCGEPKVWLFLLNCFYEITVSNQLGEIHERPTGYRTVRFYLFAVA